MPNFSSIILQFRDLSNPAGTTTIGEHQKIIAAKGYVWWGWWHKQGETVAEAAFREILKEIEKSGSYEIYLFDTGTYKLRKATLVGIKWDNTLKAIETPEPDATPAYYKGTHNRAWFKLSAIEDAVLPVEELRKWSYVRVDDFFETRKSLFNAFYDKQVCSFSELRNQERTIWFIRPKARPLGNFR